MSDPINASAPAAAPAAGSPSPAPSAPSGSAPAGDGAPAGADGGAGDPSGSRSPDGRFAAQAPAGDTPAAPAPLRTLSELAEVDPSEYSPEERKKIRISAQKGIRDDAELDARISGKPQPQARTAAKPGDKPVEGDPLSEDPAKNPAGQPLHKLVKAISPYLDPNDPDKAVENVKTLHTNIHQANTRVKELEGYYGEIETGVMERLKRGPAGIREIYKGFGLNPDEFLSGAPAAAAPAGSPAAPAIPGETPDLRDDDFLTGAQIKTLIPSITQKLRAELKAEFEREYGPLKESHGKITEAIKADAQMREVNGRREASIKDAQFHSDYYGKFHPEFKLSEPASKVWEESVKMDGGKLVLKAQQHPEWPKLAEILSFRQKEYLEPGSDAATYQDFLYRRVNESGNFFELVRNAEQKGKQTILEAQQKRLQPSLAPRGNAGPLDSFRVPKTEADVEKMTPEQRKEFRRKVLAGNIKVSN